MEDFIKHAIRVGIINECLFEDIYVLDENFIGGSGLYVRCIMERIVASLDLLGHSGL